MNHDDKSMYFIAGCLSHFLKHGGLSDRQARACNKVVSRLLDEAEAGTLDCQLVGVSTEIDTLRPRGHC